MPYGSALGFAKGFELSNMVVCLNSREAPASFVALDGDVWLPAQPFMESKMRLAKMRNFFIGAPNDWGG